MSDSSQNKVSGFEIRVRVKAEISVSKPSCSKYLTQNSHALKVFAGRSPKNIITTISPLRITFNKDVGLSDEILNTNEMITKLRYCKKSEDMGSSN